MIKERNMPGAIVGQPTAYALERTWGDEQETIPVSFTGRVKDYANRQEYIDYLLSNGVSLKLYGEKGSGTYLTHEEMVKTIQTTKININFAKTIYQNQYQLKARVFEVILWGGFLLTEWSPTLHCYFNVGKEVEAFSSKEELLEKINYFLAHPEERNEIAYAGNKRARENWSSEQIMRGIFGLIEADQRKIRQEQIARDIQES